MQFILDLISKAAFEADEADIEDIHQVDIWQHSELFPRIIVVLHTEYEECYVYFVNVKGVWHVEMAIQLPKYKLAA
jgi:hypothetical protein